MGSTVRNEQRVFSLVLALVASPEGVTKRGLLSSVYGYSERYRVGDTDIALERQFERDKHQLRKLGIQVETFNGPGDSCDNRHTRYRISKDLLQLPENLRFSERDLMLLRLAALAWREGSLNAESRRAVMKLKSLGASLDVQHLGVAPGLGICEPQAPALQRAIDDGRVVRFTYQLPGRESGLTRCVAPLRLHRADGRWHLIAWDVEREDHRVFLLSRMSGSVETTSTVFSARLREGADDAVESLLARFREQSAIVEVRVGSVAWARLACRAETSEVTADGDVRFRVGTLDLHEFASELAAFGCDAAVVEPEMLRDLVVEKLQLVAQVHSGQVVPDDNVMSDSSTVRAVGGSPHMIAQDRVALLLALVPYLRDHGPTSLTELADTFDVSPVLLRDLVRFLGTAGVPGETFSYQHEDLFDIDWEALEQDDIVSLTRTVAVDSIARFSPAETAALLAGLHALTTVLPEADSHTAQALAKRIAHALGVSETPITVTAEPHPPAVATIVHALEHDLGISFNYTDVAGVSSSRIVDPYDLSQHGVSWYLRGWCQSRHAERTFRVEQMDHVNTITLSNRTTATEVNDQTTLSDVVALIPAHLRYRIASFCPSVISHTEETLRVRVEAWHPQTAVRLVQHAPGEVVIESPSTAREAVRIWATLALSRYDA